MQRVQTRVRFPAMVLVCRFTPCSLLVAMLEWLRETARLDPRLQMSHLRAIRFTLS